MPDLVLYRPPSQSEWAQLNEFSNLVAPTEFVPRALRGKPGAVLACVLTGRELGIGPMQSLKHIHLVEGKAGMSAELMAGLVRAAGHKLRIIERTPSRVQVQGVRCDDPDHPTTVAFTIEDAQRVGLASKGVWKSYPEAMLAARAISALCRLLFADVLAGCSYIPDELEELAVDTTNVTVGPVVVDPVSGEITAEAPAKTKRELWEATAHRIAAEHVQQSGVAPEHGEGNGATPDQPPPDLTQPTSLLRLARDAGIPQTTALRRLRAVPKFAHVASAAYDLHPNDIQEALAAIKGPTK